MFTRHEQLSAIYHKTSAVKCNITTRHQQLSAIYHKTSAVKCNIPAITAYNHYVQCISVHYRVRQSINGLTPDATVVTAA